MSTPPAADTNRPAAPPRAEADANDDNAAPQVATGGSNQSNNSNNSNNASPAPAPLQELPTETPMGIQLFVNVITICIGLVVFVMLFQNIGEGYILAANAPSDVTGANFSVEASAVQLMADGQIEFFIGAFLVCVVANAFNIAELFFPGVIAKHRVKQLIINRIASGFALTFFLFCLSAVPGYVARKNGLTTDAGRTAHASVLSFWILVLILAPFMILSHRLTPNENKRRFDRAGSMFEDDEYSPYSHRTGRAPDNY